MKPIVLRLFKWFFKKEIEEAKREMSYVISSAAYWEGKNRKDLADHYHGRISGYLPFIKMTDSSFNLPEEFKKATEAIK